MKAHRAGVVPAALAVAACQLAGCGASAGRYSRRSKRTISRAGVRAGCVSFRGFEKRELDDRPLAGFYVRLGTEGRFVWELGADAAVDIDEPRDWQLYFGRVDGLFFPSKRGRAYLHATAGAIGEHTPSYDYVSGLAGVGAGWILPAGRTALDIRLSYLALVESENSQAALAITLGYGF